ncbi:hypothetical protein GCM10029978_047230 [Actinoallomurus acanthiterrae]
MISPRVVGTAALLAVVSLAVPTAAEAKTQLKTQARPQAAAPPQLTLPAPTGPSPLGTVSLHLVDRSRKDPFAAPATTAS